jgi:hypothetical protein
MPPADGDERHPDASSLTEKHFWKITPRKARVQTTGAIQRVSSSVEFWVCPIMKLNPFQTK